MSDLRFATEEFERACSLLPEGVMWGEHLSVEIVLHIAEVSRHAAIKEAVEACEALNDEPASWGTPTDCADAIRALADGYSHE